VRASKGLSTSDKSTLQRFHDVQQLSGFFHALLIDHPLECLDSILGRPTLSGLGLCLTSTLQDVPPTGSTVYENDSVVGKSLSFFMLAVNKCWQCSNFNALKPTEKTGEESGHH